MDTPDPPFEDPSVELSANRTAMSFERTRMSLDRTLMSVIRTSLSLIGFGFTVFQVFHSLINKMPGVLPTHAPRRFAMTLIAIGVALLVIGLFNHIEGALGLRARRQRLYDASLIHHTDQIRVSSITVVAILLLLTGLLLFVGILFRVGPFS